MIRGCLRSITASRPSAQCNHVFHPAAVQSLRNNTSDSVLNIDYIVLGLGNADIIKSRHSIGMRIVAGLAPMIKSSQWIRDKELFAHTCVATLPNGKTALLVKSHLAMNDNGKTAARAVSKYLLTPRQLIVVHDQMELDVGEVSWKEGSIGTKGHKGVRSVTNCLMSPDFARLHVGIGHPGKEAVADFVLEVPEPKERNYYTSSSRMAKRMVIDRICPGAADKFARMPYPLDAK